MAVSKTFPCLISFLTSLVTNAEYMDTGCVSHQWCDLFYRLLHSYSVLTLQVSTAKPMIADLVE